MSDVLVEIRNLSKKFKNKHILNGLNLIINEGEHILIEGKNACGKSTLLKIIANIYEKTSGEIICYKKFKIGAFIENPSFIENETALYNMKFLIELTDKFNIEKIRPYFELLELDIDNKDTVNKYSVGMRQKLGIIQAVMEDQDLILFDEPTRGLDKDSVEKFYSLIKMLKAQNRTCIIVAHDGVSGIDFDKSYVIEDGKCKEKMAV
ncbi:MAG: ABC transporter ATP-binding protein [Erysipelotrichaceae bacterium]|nr:ABC transporter ATP-binding protein [Erysipelotrichaceae bacterium]